MKHFETKWKSQDGLDVFAQGWSPDTSQPGAVVCLVHGIGEHTSRYLKVAEAFTKEAYVLFGADLRGHGRTEGPRGHIPSMKLVLQDIDLLIENARKLYPNLPVILYGHSLGGTLVLNYGLTQKPNIKGIIATSPSLKTAVEEQVVKVVAAKILGALLPRVTISTGLDASAISNDKKVVEIYQDDPLVHDKMSMGFGKIILGVMQRTLEHADRFSLPLLLMHGKADSITYPSGSIEFASKLHEKCKLVLWEGASHELHNEPEKAEVFKTMIDWINELVNKHHNPTNHFAPL